PSLPAGLSRVPACGLGPPVDRLFALMYPLRKTSSRVRLSLALRRDIAYATPQSDFGREHRSLQRLQLKLSQQVPSSKDPVCLNRPAPPQAAETSSIWIVSFRIDCRCSRTSSA